MGGSGVERVSACKFCLATGRVRSSDHLGTHNAPDLTVYESQGVKILLGKFLLWSSEHLPSIKGGNRRWSGSISAPRG